ncbi:efflux RND transporter periplasmic adaptor subunit [Hyphomonas sp.]|uniref:efflux RND transporter periplasmic adaptor subunit n=1 Tax=Hyphomonas sp. TaxID=87 RepID=UPI000A564C88|nr:efflux RND transporter periplasmic adaptor subunit [Hyphomonas sp.]
MTDEAGSEKPVVLPAPGPPEPASDAPAVKTRRQRLLAGAIIVAAVAGLAAWWFTRPPDVSVLQVEPRLLEKTLSVVGRVRPENLVDVRSPNPGQVVDVFRDDGDRVEAGDALATIRSSSERAEAEAFIARERAAKAEVNRAKLVFNRTRTLTERGVASQAALDEARAVLQVAEADLEAATAERASIAARNNEFTIRAPMAGIVLVRPIDNGQVISAEATLFQLGSVGRIELQADVDEAYADVLQPGMSARAALSGSDRIFGARLLEISPRVDAATGGRLVKFVPNEALDIPLGRSVDITIVVEVLEAAISVPREAVLDAATQPKVYVVDREGRVQVRAVQIADWPSLDAIVESGLTGEDRVVLTPAETSPSARVRERVLPPAPTQGP